MARVYLNILLLIMVYPQNNAREYQVKAAFIFNFTQFIDWPDNAFADKKAPLVIGILGENPFGNQLGEIVSGERANGHPLVVQQFKSGEQIKMCHILFINLSGNELKDEIASLKGRAILTVSDRNDFIEQGGIIRLITTDNKIRLQINSVAARAAGLTISSRLLRISDIVTTGN